MIPAGCLGSWRSPGSELGRLDRIDRRVRQARGRRRGRCSGRIRGLDAILRGVPKSPQQIAAPVQFVVTCILARQSCAQEASSQTTRPMWRCEYLASIGPTVLGIRTAGRNLLRSHCPQSEAELAQRGRSISPKQLRCTGSVRRGVGPEGVLCEPILRAKDTPSLCT